MAVEMKIPAVGESISEVTVASWVKNDGDYVEMDEVICELESDKATFELTAEATGILKTNTSEGDTLEIGAVICSIEPSEGAPAKTEETPVVEVKNEAPVNLGVPQKTGKIHEMIVPTVGESISEITIAS